MTCREAVSRKNSEARTLAYVAPRVISTSGELVRDVARTIRGFRRLSEWQANKEYKGWMWGIVDVPVDRFFGPAEKINITVPGRLPAD
jgi:hypothetical protein